ncbi:hypothetical protein, partial [Leyella stercorea]|uniref:hypothetical protein n=1 Tax=Leyella stercorea TaxID=363265 RepID=UPI002674F4BC
CRFASKIPLNPIGCGFEEHLKIRKVMWWEIILGVIGFAVIGFIGMVIKMAITEAKEETRDIERASKSEN